MLFRSLLVTLLAVTPLALATPTPVANAEASTADLEDRTFFGWCSLDKTRNPYDCQCRPGLSEPNHWKKTLSLLKKECVCGDSKNSHFDHWSKSCQCSGHNQHYNTQTKRCECDSGYEAAMSKRTFIIGYPHHNHNDGKLLQCKKTDTNPPPPNPSGKPPSHYKRAIEAAAVDTKKLAKKNAATVSFFGQLEAVLGCEYNQRGCQKDGQWTCTDVLSNLYACGNCPGMGQDCSSLPNVDQVRCQEGACIIDSCAPGFSIVDGECQKVPLSKFHVLTV